MHGVTKRVARSLLRAFPFAVGHYNANARRSFILSLTKSRHCLCRSRIESPSVEEASPGIRVPISDLNRTFYSTDMAKSTISMDDYDVYGFDVDHTLSGYNIPNLFDLVYDGYTKFLVEKKGYHKDLLEPFSKWKDFCFRGLVFDVKRGNLLKVAADGKILKASHGTRYLSAGEISESYGGPVWGRKDQLLNKVDNIEGEKGERDYMIFDNMFDIVGTVMLARMVDVVDKQLGKPPKGYREHFDKFLEACGETYGHLNFSTRTGSYFPAAADAPSKYIKACPDATKTWLKSLRKEGKAVFFLTSSHVDYATHVLNNSLGSDWRNYFDIGISRARKPTFFTAGRPFLRLDGVQEKEPVQKLERGQVYSQGNHGELMKFLSKVTGKDKLKVLYFGDSIRSDIFPSRQYADWDTVAIIDEIKLEPDQQADKNGQPAAKRQKLEDHDQLSQEYISSDGWGSFFHHSPPSDKPDASSGDKHINTLWGSILRKYATIAVPSVDHIAELPKEHKFTVFNPESSKCGFSPHPPKVLQKRS